MLRIHEHPRAASEPDAHFVRVLNDLGLHRAIGVLNLRTWHRYTGVYQFNRRSLRNITLFDKQDLAVTFARDEAMSTTYGAIVARYSTVFATSDALRDERLAGHPARHHVRAFHAVPLLDYTERCFGMICHWDPEPRTLDPREMRLMVSSAPVVARALLGTRFRSSAA